MTTPLERVALDMAGTTVRDDGVEEHVFPRSADATALRGVLIDREMLPLAIAF